jgi:hypothetical protein
MQLSDTQASLPPALILAEDAGEAWGHFLETISRSKYDSGEQKDASNPAQTGRCPELLFVANLSGRRTYAQIIYSYHAASLIGSSPDCRSRR